jgi:hypothetical protein
VVEVTFPEEYPVDYLKGRAATFDVTVNEVQTPKEAQADDSFAKSMGLESIEQLRWPPQGSGRAGAERPHPHPHEAPAARSARRRS